MNTLLLKPLVTSLTLLGMLIFALPSTASANPIPSGWTCIGACGSLGANGVVTLSPAGNPSYQYVSTFGGATGVGALPTGLLGSETNGSTLATSVFTANAGTNLNFYFNYVTSDGAGFTDYAWAELFNSSNNPVSLLFTARSELSGSIVPGLGMPPSNAALTPPSVPIIPGMTTWLPLGSSSGACFISTSSGCGYTGWINANYTIPTAGSYYLEVGVTNWVDTQFDSGLAIDGVTVGGVPIIPTSPIPEPSTLVLLSSGLLSIAGAAKRKRSA
jgi:hypothetical protein